MPADRAALVDALRVCRRWIVEGQAQIGWSVDRIDEVLAAAALAAPPEAAPTSLVALVRRWQEAYPDDDAGDESFGAAEEALLAWTLPCIGHDPACPCQDGDPCHYRPTATTAAMVPPSALAKFALDETPDCRAAVRDGQRWEPRTAGERLSYEQGYADARTNLVSTAVRAALQEVRAEISAMPDFLRGADGDPSGFAVEDILDAKLAALERQPTREGPC